MNFALFSWVEWHKPFKNFLKSNIVFPFWKIVNRYSEDDTVDVVLQSTMQTKLSKLSGKTRLFVLSAFSKVKRWKVAWCNGEYFRSTTIKILDDMKMSNDFQKLTYFSENFCAISIRHIEIPHFCQFFNKISIAYLLFYIFVALVKIFSMTSEGLRCQRQFCSDVTVTYHLRLPEYLPLSNNKWPTLSRDWNGVF